MRAWIIEQEITESALHAVHGIGGKIKRILVPYGREALSLTFHNNNVYVFPMTHPSAPTKNYTVLKEVDIPNEMADAILGMEQAKLLLYQFGPMFQTYMK